MSVRDPMSAEMTVRHCRDEEDLRRLQALVARLWAKRGPRVSMHVGDVVWRYCRHAEPMAGELFPMWVDGAGEVVGFVQFDPGGSADLAIEPDHWNAELAGAMLGLAEEKRREVLAESRQGGGLTVGCFEGDWAGQYLLISRGYGETGQGSVHLRRTLGRGTDAGALPAGYAVRTMDSFGDCMRMVESGRCVPGRANLDAGRYRRMMAAGFLPEQDVVVVDGRESIVAGCIWWFDAANNVGELEPVGCHPEHRRKGLGRAVVGEALRRLGSMGARTAVVYVNKRNEAGLRLYESCGFEYVGTDRDFYRPL